MFIQPFLTRRLTPMIFHQSGQSEPGWRVDPENGGAEILSAPNEPPTPLIVPGDTVAYVVAYAEPSPDAPVIYMADDPEVA